MIDSMCNKKLLDQEELNFMAHISCKGADFELSLTKLLRKRRSLDMALDRFKKAKKDFYHHECEHADALISARDKIKDLHGIIEKYQDYMRS